MAKSQAMLQSIVDEDKKVTADDGKVNARSTGSFFFSGLARCITPNSCQQIDDSHGHEVGTPSAESKPANTL